MHQSLFHKMLGVQPSGNGYFTAESSRGGLGDDGSVMMISGVPNGLGSAPLAPWMQDANTVKPGLVPNPEYGLWKACMERPENAGKPGACGAQPPPYISAGTASSTLAGNTALNTPVKLFNVELPLWAWLAIAALLGGAGGYYLGRR